MKTRIILILGLIVYPIITGSWRFTEAPRDGGFDIEITRQKFSDTTILLKWYPDESRIATYDIRYRAVGSSSYRHIKTGNVNEIMIDDLLLEGEYEFIIDGYDRDQQLVETSGVEYYTHQPQRVLQGFADSSRQQMFELKMLSLDASLFPNIISYVQLDTLGLGGATISRNNFRTFEDGRLQSDCFDVILPDSSGGLRMVDIVFLIDNTGSINPEFDVMVNNVGKFVDSLQSRGVDFTLGLVIFGQQKNDGWPILIENGKLTHDVEEFKVWLSRMTDRGKWEYGLNAILKAATEIVFRPTSARHFLLISDDDSDGNNIPQLIQDIVKICKQNNIIVHCAVDSERNNSYWHYCDPEKSVRATGGLLFPVVGPYDEILDELLDVISRTYIVTYCTDNPRYDAQQREVIINCSLLNHTSQDTGYYVCGGAPKIVRTSETKTLSNRSQIEKVKIPIAAYVTDKVAPYAHTASLFYRRAGSNSFQELKMVNTQDSTWTEFIPAPSIQFPGIEYYLTAADYYITTSDPPFDPGQNPYYIAVHPNKLPTIKHDPIKEYYTLFQPIAVNCLATDSTNYLQAVKLYFRKTGTALYTISEMMRNSVADNYYASIPGSFVTLDGIDYYISATDNFGLTSYHGSSAEPHRMVAVIVDSIVIEAEEMDNRVRQYGNACDDGWRLTHENHPLQADVTLDGSGYYLFTIVAKAEIGNALAPWLRVKVGDEFSGTCEINATAWEKYLFVTSLTAGTHRLSLNYLNDYWVRHVADRNLLLDKVIIKYYGAQIPLLVAYTFEAEDMGHQHPNNYQDGAFMVLHRPYAYVGHDLYLDKPDLSCTLFARADETGGNWPIVDVLFDELIVNSFLIDQPGCKSYQINLTGIAPLPVTEPGLHSIKFVYNTNSWAYHRNLYIDKMIIYSNGGFLKPVMAADDQFQSAHALPATVVLEQNYPNPFNPETNINYQLPHETPVVIQIFNTLGQVIRTLVDSYQSAGQYTVYWDGTDQYGKQVVSGVYLYRMKAGTFVSIKKMAFLK